MQDRTLSVNLRDGSVNNWNKNPLLCTLSKSGCQNTSTDPILIHGRNRTIVVRKQFEGKMIKSGYNFLHF